MSEYQRRYILSIIIVVIIILTGCEKDDDQDDMSLVNQYVYALMQEWYLWYDHLPEVDPNDYATPEELMDALTYKPLDKWSYIEDKETADQYYEEGKYIGYGHGWKYDIDNNVYITLVYRDSPMYRAGIRRGFRVLEINGQDIQYIGDNDLWSEVLGEDVVGVQARFKFENLEDEIIDVVVVKNIVTINPVAHSEIKTIGSTNVGYLVFTTFIRPSLGELDTAFDQFQAAGVTELILDLRYNGGGLGSVGSYLAGLIGGYAANNQTYTQYAHNDKKTKDNWSDRIQIKDQSLQLSRVIIITTPATASASEALINGLRPYMEVILIGDDTYGKPVGMYLWEYGNKKIVPVAYRILNSRGEGDYYHGIPVDVYRRDHIQQPFGDLNETSLQEALFYIEHGYFSDEASVTVRSVYPDKQIHRQGFYQEIGTF